MEAMTFDDEVDKTFYLRGSVLDCPNGLGALLAQTLIPWTLWQLKRDT